ncbi:16344_t:CDS:2, partial [Rhizophagus irregularis]
GNPRYIYYIGKSDYIEEWLRKSEKARKNHENFLSKPSSSEHDECISSDEVICSVKEIAENKFR